METICSEDFSCSEDFNLDPGKLGNIGCFKSALKAVVVVDCVVVGLLDFEESVGTVIAILLSSGYVVLSKKKEEKIFTAFICKNNFMINKSSKLNNHYET